MSLILNVLTLGMLPLWRMLNGRGPPDPIRRAYVNVQLSRFNTPSRKVAAKVLKKFYFDPKELEMSLTSLSHGYAMYVPSEDVGEQLVDALQSAGFELEFETTDELAGPVLFTSGKYVELTRFNSCNHCGRSPVRVYRDDEDYRCSSCDSSDVTVIANLSNKEILKHVERTKAGRQSLEF